MTLNRFTADHRATVLTGAVVAPFLACTLLTLVRTTVENTNAALVLVLLVVGIASLGSRAAGLLAALSSAVWFDFFLTAPYERFVISDRDDLQTAVLLVLVGAAVTELALWGRRQQGRASERDGYLAGIMATAATMNPAGDPAPAGDLITTVEHQIEGLLDLDSADFQVGQDPGLPRLEPDGTLRLRGRQLDVDRLGLPTDTAMTLPVRNGGRDYGSLRLVAATQVSRPSLERRRVAALMAERVGAVLAEQDRSSA